MALTPLIMKTFKNIMKDELLYAVQADWDHLQFAYKSCRGVDDAISTLLNMFLTHFGGCKVFSVITFLLIFLLFLIVSSLIF